MAAYVQSGAALAGRSYLDPSANPRSGSCNDNLADMSESGSYVLMGQLLSFEFLFVASIAAAVSGCSDGQEKTSSRFDEEVIIVTYVSDAGGALGETTYRLEAAHDGEQIPFFEGSNPKNFRISKRGPNQISVRFCDGNIRLAQPIFVPSDGRLIHLHVEMDCTSPS